ncbi:E3 ubiquitin-protein ligase CCNB1IP1-like [Scyliorhinus canicula]|uniref:E3 ubiquitin-protein ligase CCNB1IP1-like n=1 Tax=Scyliorhinus canicula TaxID=7830 RepID=UPI0018F4701D|nr:E3 ubiquitin-protein ligase CCNB1IP1-like [Scyliorhinus canicula]
MALCEDSLLCNLPGCRCCLSGFAWVTACSHVFCDQHGSGQFSRSPALCPACGTALSGKRDIVRTDLNPPEDYKGMVLSGLRPHTVLEIAGRALAFWGYQIHQERMYQESAYSKAEGRLKQMDKLYTQQLQGKDMEVSNSRSEVSSLKKMLEEYKKKYSEVSEKLMDRNRQYQKLQGFYDSLRLRSMAMVGGGDAPAAVGPAGALYGMPLGTSAAVTSHGKPSLATRVQLPAPFSQRDLECFRVPARNPTGRHVHVLEKTFFYHLCFRPLEMSVFLPIT